MEKLAGQTTKQQARRHESQVQDVAADRLVSTYVQLSAAYCHGNSPWLFRDQKDKEQR